MISKDLFDGLRCRTDSLPFRRRIPHQHPKFNRGIPLMILGQIVIYPHHLRPQHRNRFPHLSVDIFLRDELLRNKRHTQILPPGGCRNNRPVNRKLQ